MTRYACLEDARLRINTLKQHLDCSDMKNELNIEIAHNIIDDIDNDIRQAMEEWE